RLFHVTGVQTCALPISAGAYHLATLPEHAVYLERMAASPTRAGLSQAALETLAIIVYRQPITRIEIEEIRGVKSDRAIQTLVTKDRKRVVRERGELAAV